MAVQRRQHPSKELIQISSRVPLATFHCLDDFAWNHRWSMARAITRLLSKALQAESGGEYTPETDPHHENNTTIKGE
jgi:hypothetical protein